MFVLHFPTLTRPVAKKYALVMIGMGIVACVAIALAIVGLQVGPVALTVALVAAMLPIPVMIALFRWLDEFNSRPWRLIAAAFGWGAGVAALVALTVNTISGRHPLPIGSEFSHQNQMWVAVIVSPIVEEISKGFPLLFLLYFRRNYINGIIDSIVYSGLIAVGFAFTENVLYFGYELAGKFSHITANELWQLFINRAVMSPFAHPLFTCMAGVGVGFAAAVLRPITRIIVASIGLVLAMGTHCVWNLFATSLDMRTQLVGYLLVMVPLFCLMIAISLWAKSHQIVVVSRSINIYAHLGWFSGYEIATLATVKGRKLARQWAKTTLGRPGLNHMLEYQQAVNKLAVLRDGAYYNRSNAQFGLNETQLLEQITLYRQMLLTRPLLTSNRVEMSAGKSE